MTARQETVQTVTARQETVQTVTARQETGHTVTASLSISMIIFCRDPLMPSILCLYWVKVFKIVTSCALPDSQSGHRVILLETQAS